MVGPLKSDRLDKATSGSPGLNTGGSERQGKIHIQCPLSPSKDGLCASVLCQEEGLPR